LYGGRGKKYSVFIERIFNFLWILLYLDVRFRLEVLPPGFRHPLDSMLPERLALLSEVPEDTQSVAEHADCGVGGVEDIVSMPIMSLV